MNLCKDCQHGQTAITRNKRNYRKCHLYDDLAINVKTTKCKDIDFVPLSALKTD